MNNATYNTFGAGYVAASGNETGMWCDNIAIGAQGIGLAGSFVDKNADDVAANDLGRSGDGFFFRGRMLKVDDNVAADVKEGFVYMVRGSGATIDAQDLPQPDILHGLTSTTDVTIPPIQDFTDNEVLAADIGLMVIKADPAQGHDVRSVIDGFKAWEVDTGIDLEYTAHYTILNADLTGAKVGRTFGSAEKRHRAWAQHLRHRFQSSPASPISRMASMLSRVDNRSRSHSGSPQAQDFNYVFIDVA